jgi:hypothetical protein
MYMLACMFASSAVTFHMQFLLDGCKLNVSKLQSERSQLLDAGTLHQVAS